MKYAKSFATYLCNIIKNVVFIICFALDILGAMVIYFGKFTLPNYTYYVVLLVGFVISNYQLYSKNAPQINISCTLLRKYPFKALHCNDTYVSLMANYNIYINNSSNSAGIIEDIKVDLNKFCNVKDKYLLDKINVSFEEYFISNKEIFTPLEFMKSKEEVNFPILIDPKSNVRKILILYIEIQENSREDFKKTLAWIDDFKFVVTVTTINNNIKKDIIYNIKLSKDKISEFIEKEKKSNEKISEYFKKMEEE